MYAHKNSYLNENRYLNVGSYNFSGTALTLDDATTFSRSRSLFMDSVYTQTEIGSVQAQAKLTHCWSRRRRRWLRKWRLTESPSKLDNSSQILRQRKVVEIEGKYNSKPQYTDILVLSSILSNNPFRRTIEQICRTKGSALGIQLIVEQCSVERSSA